MSKAIGVTQDKTTTVATRGRGRRFAALALVVGMVASVGTVLTAAPASAAPPTNDDFAYARVLSGPYIEVSGTNVDATKEAGEPNHAGRPGGASVWYRWTPDSTRPVRISTCASASSWSSMLAVYTGAAVDDLTVVASNYRTQGCGLYGGHSTVVLTAVAGQTYSIAVDGNNGTTGPIGLSIEPADPPAHDNFADAETVGPTLPVTAGGTNVDASAEVGEPEHATIGGSSVWYRWTPDADGRVVVETCNSDFDTLLGVYTGDVVDALTVVEQNDNTPNCGRSAAGGTLGSRVAFAATAGQPYQIAVDGRLAVTGQVGLEIRNVDAADNDGFAAAQVLSSPLPISETGSSLDATKEAGEPDHAGNPGGASVWYRWTPDAAGTAVLETCASEFDTLLAVYTGDSVDSLTVAASNDDTAGCGGPGQSASRSRVTLAVVAGETYAIAIDGRNGASGSIALTLRAAEPPANDDFSDAQLLGGPLPIKVSGTNVDATREGGEPNHAGQAGSASVWYSWTADASGQVLLDSCAESPLVAVYTGSGVDVLTSASNDNTKPCGYGSARFMATAGQTYRIAIDEIGGAWGPFEFELRRPPANDNFADAQLLSGALPLTVAGTSIDASQEPGEPYHAGVTGRRSIWYRWTADNDEPVVIDTCQSAGDTAVGVYTGAAVNALTTVASNDDACGSQSRVVFTPVAQQTYSIAIDLRGAAAAGAPISLTIRRPNSPANDDFAAAELLDGPLPIDIEGTNDDATTEAGEPDHAGFSPTASVWYRWTPAASGRVVVDLCGSNFDTLLGVYSGASLGALTAVASDDDGCGPGAGSILWFEATAGATYSIAVGGWQSEAGSIELSMRVPPANDQFAASGELDGPLPIEANSTSVDASAEAAEPDHAGYNAHRSVWYAWTPNTSETVVINTCGSQIATALAVYTGNQLDALTEVASDVHAPECGYEHGSSLRLVATAGTTYRIAIETGEESGPVNLRIEMPLAPPANDAFADAVTLSGAMPIQASGTTAGATTEPGEPEHYNGGGASIWYRWRADVSGGVVVETCGTDPELETEVYVYTGGAVDDLTLASGVAYDRCGNQSRLQLNAIAGQTYQIAVDSFAGTGPVVLRLRQPAEPPNDDFADAEPLSARLPVSVSGTNAEATVEEGEPYHAGYSYRSVWYRWTADFSGSVVIETCSSDFDTVLAVYTGTAVDALMSVAANDDGCGLQSTVVVPVSAGETYRVAVDGYGGESGAIALAVRTAPANDDFAAAQVLTGRLATPLTPIAAMGSNLDASVEPGEPDHAGRAGGASLWYRWTPRVSRPISIATCGSRIDTTLGVYTGTAIDSLTEVASDDDHGCGSTSRVRFTARAGRTYWIAVDGADGAQGRIMLAIRSDLLGSIPW